MIRIGVVIVLSLATLCGTVFFIWRQQATPVLARQTFRVLSEASLEHFYTEFDAAFSEYWRIKTRGASVDVMRSIVGEGDQKFESSFESTGFDVAHAATSWEIDELARKRQFVNEAWEYRLPSRSTPFHTTVVFVTRAGNPKRIFDWPDLARSDVTPVITNPRKGWSARWMYLAAWGDAMLAAKGDESLARASIGKVYRNVTAGDAIEGFTRQGIGDVLIALECDARRLVADASTNLELVSPPRSIRVDMPVTVIDRFADAHRVREIADAYVEFLYTDRSQRIALRHHFRPTMGNLGSEVADKFADVEMFSIHDAVGGWDVAWTKHFSSGGVFDQVSGK